MLEYQLNFLVVSFLMFSAIEFSVFGVKNLKGADLIHIFRKEELDEMKTMYMKPLYHEDITCDKLKYCDMSERLEVVCGSDGKLYLNPGVLWCAQKCNPDLTVKKIGVCDEADRAANTDGR